MKKMKFILFFLISLSCLIFAGCGAHIDSKINLNPDGSGKRDIICTIPDSNFKGILGGETALDSILKKNKPGILTMQKEKSNSSTIYTFTYNFKSFDDYLSKSESLIGSKPDSSFDISGEAFQKKYTFQEENLNYKLMKWAVDAVSVSGLAYTGRDKMYETGQTTVTMDGKSEKFNDKVNFSVEKAFSVDRISVYTKMNSDNTYSRDITYYFTESIFSALNENGSGLDNYMKNLIPNGGKLSIINASGGVKGYKISFSAANPEDLSTKTEAASKDKKTSFKITKLSDTSVFRPQNRISESINFSDYTSGAAIDKGISYSFETPQGYTCETLMGSSASVKASRLQTVSSGNASESINFIASYHVINYSAYITLILITISVLALVCMSAVIFLRKVKALKLTNTYENTVSEETTVRTVTRTLRDETTLPEASAAQPGKVRCRICGSENKGSSNFCMYCGAPIIKLENISFRNIINSIKAKANSILNKLKPSFSMKNVKKWMGTGEYKDILAGAALTLGITFAISFSLGSVLSDKTGFIPLNSIKELPSGINKVNSSVSLQPWDIMYLSYMPSIKESIGIISSAGSSSAAAVFHIPMLILLPIPVLGIWIGTKISTRKLDAGNIKAKFRYSALISLLNSIVLALLSLILGEHYSIPAVNGFKTGVDITLSYSFFSVFAGSLLLGFIVSAFISLRSFSYASGGRTSGTFTASSVNGIAKGIRNAFIAILAVYIAAVICLPFLNHGALGNAVKTAWKEDHCVEYVIAAPNAICNTFTVSNAGTVSISPQIAGSAVFNPMSVRSDLKNGPVSYNVFKNISDSPWYIYLGLLFPIIAVTAGIYYTMLSERRRLTPRDTISFSALYGIASAIIAYINGISVKISAGSTIAKALGIKGSSYKMQYSFNSVLIFISSFILCVVIAFTFDEISDKVRNEKKEEAVQE